MDLPAAGGDLDRGGAVAGGEPVPVTEPGGIADGAGDGGGTAASWPVSQASAELGLLADLFTRDQDVSAAKTRAALGWEPACTSIVKYLTA